MLLVPLLIWYSRRSEPISIRDVQRCLAIGMITLFLVPGDLAISNCNAEQPETSGHLIIREGTRIPPTTGRVVMIGRRWAFIPAGDQANTEAVVADNATNTKPLQQIILQENLMLQRIAKAINIDQSDDHWVISGAVTEFFKENRLSIQIAQRANRR